MAAGVSITDGVFPNRPKSSTETNADDNKNKKLSLMGGEGVLRVSKNLEIGIKNDLELASR